MSTLKPTRPGMTLLKRTVFLYPLLLTASTGVVLASSSACRVVVLQGMRQAQGTVHKRVHHSAETLARWKVGAEAWSKAHDGKVYAGRPARHKQDWKPLTFTCEEVALDPTRPEGGLLTGEPLPEFAAYAVSVPMGTVEIAGVTPPGGSDPVYGGSGFFGAPSLFPVGGGAPNGPVGPTSIPPVSSTGTRLTPGPQQPTQATPLPAPPTGVKFIPTPQQPTQAMPLPAPPRLTPYPQPPTVSLLPEPKEGTLDPFPQPTGTVSLLPVPEPPGFILLVTGVVLVSLSMARRLVAGRA